MVNLQHKLNKYIKIWADDEPLVLYLLEDHMLIHKIPFTNHPLYCAS